MALWMIKTISNIKEKAALVFLLENIAKFDNEI
jgi:hypothetical protein